MNKDGSIIAYLTNERRLVNFFGFAFMGALSVVIVIPFYYLFASSLKSLGQYAATDPKNMWLPYPLHPENFMKAIKQYRLLTYIWNSLWLGVAQTTLSALSSSIVAYGFARFKFPGRDFIFVVLLASMFLPSQVTQVPLYQLYRAIGWTNSFKPLILGYCFGGPWNIFLLRQMMLNVPREMDEAAYMDGAGTWRTFWHVMMPQIKPALIVVVLFTFLGSWKDLFGPLLYLSDAKNYTIPLGLLFFQAPTEKVYTVQLAAITVALVPTVVIYLFGNKYLESGINVADLK